MQMRTPEYSAFSVGYYGAARAALLVLLINPCRVVHFDTGTPRHAIPHQKQRDVAQSLQVTAAGFVIGLREGNKSRSSSFK